MAIERVMLVAQGRYWNLTKNYASFFLWEIFIICYDVPVTKNEACAAARAVRAAPRSGRFPHLDRPPKKVRNLMRIKLLHAGSM